MKLSTLGPNPQTVPQFSIPAIFGFLSGLGFPYIIQKEVGFFGEVPGRPRLPKTESPRR